MGDVVRTLPSMRAIRTAYPEARISWLVERAAAGVLENVEGLDDVMIFPREALSASLRSGNVLGLWSELREFVLALRNRNHDLVLDFHSILKSGAISFLSGARCRVTYAPPFGREWGWLWANHRARVEPHHTSRYERNAGLVRYLGIEATETHTQASGSILRVDRKARARIDAHLGESHPQIESHPQVLIHPGSSGHTAYKRYKPEGYASLSRKLEKDTGVATLVCRGTSAEELALAEEIVAKSMGAAALAPETPKLRDLIALIDRAQLFIGSDSGPLHLAASLGTPVVQIIGPTDPVENLPLQTTPTRQVRVPVPCSPCRRGCPAATCMQIIPHETVYRAALEILEWRPAASPRRITSSQRPVAAAPASPACP
jgi:ADP-heptose:LPS heptosyltransferase